MPEVYCPLCGGAEEDMSCLKIHIMIKHQAGNPEQLIRTFQGLVSGVQAMEITPTCHVGAKEGNDGAVAQLLPLPKIRIAHKKAAEAKEGNSRKDTQPKSIRVIDLPEKKSLGNQRKRAPARVKVDVPKQKSCTDSPPAKRMKARCPITSMAKINSTARPHPSQSNGRVSSELKVNAVLTDSKAKREELLSSKKNEEIIVIGEDTSSATDPLEAMKSHNLKIPSVPLLVNEELVEKLDLLREIRPEPIKEKKNSVGRDVSVTLKRNPPKIETQGKNLVQMPSRNKKSRSDKMMAPADKSNNKRASKEKESRILKKSNNRRRESLARQTEKAILSCLVWAKEIPPNEAYEKMVYRFSKVPPGCITGIIAALYPKRMRPATRKEGTERSHTERLVIRSSSIDVPVETGGQLRQSQAATSDPSVEP